VLRVLFTNMHDWHLANEIKKIVLDYADKNNLKNVRKIELELGSIIEHNEEISSENLIHNLNLMFEKTIAENCKIFIKKINRDEWKLISIEGSD